MEYNESHNINVLTDVKFVVVTVKLPLGRESSPTFLARRHVPLISLSRLLALTFSFSPVLFQEHEIGCWVSKVVPDGNGGRRGVQQGDQLAAIDGRSAVHATIDEAATAISDRGKGGRGVELTFLRYVGPLRPVPGSVIQEGFEVTGKGAKSPKGRRMKGFGRSSSSGGGGNKSGRGLFKGRRGSSRGPPSPGARSSANTAAELNVTPRSPGRRGWTKGSKATPPPSPARGNTAAASQSATPGSAQSRPPSTPDRPSKGAKGKSIRNILRRGKK